MASPLERRFQNDILAALTLGGWKVGDAKRYDARRALYPEDVLAFYQAVHPKAWLKFKACFTKDPDASLLDEVAKNLDKHGALHLLRKGFKTRGAEVRLAQFRPDNDLNPNLWSAYGQNILRVVPEVTYGAHGAPGRIDLVLFVNGIPTATLELKSEFTQAVAAAMTQYRRCRPPVDPTTRRPEPLLTFKRGALVHFAVSQTEVFMTTRLAGGETRFLPFNRGTSEGGAGNPPNPTGYDTSYLWERVFAPDAWLQILHRFVHLEQKSEVDAHGRLQVKEEMIFPRFHQWEAVALLLEAARQEGPGHRYLVQHSAGSGKSNSIAWTAHQLASLYTPEGQKLFRSVIVVTDRTVLDDQLQETIAQFEHQAGVMETISNKGSETSKSQRLTKALVEGRPIIVVTLQTFPFVLQALREQATLKGESFAVIADEAHSSQSGRTAIKLREALISEQLDEDTELTSEDMINLALEARQATGTISYFAFTATPKAKTLELFGRLPKPNEPKGEGNLPRPFHLYSMRQAIEEGFILDVLRNFVTYDRAYELAQRDPNKDQEVPEHKAGRALGHFVRLHPKNIAQKAAIIVDHFRDEIAPLLAGQAKSMVVTSGRKDAVRFKLAIDAYVRDQAYTDVKALVAFSGDVLEGPGELDGYDGVLAREQSRPAPDGAGRAFDEGSMNPGVRGDLREAYDQRGFNILVVANKFQTGFNQPKLTAMYVDKRLSGIDAVQTLSRLNRTYPGKDAKGTFILDFQNSADDIAEAFRPYYGETYLASASNPDLVYDLQLKLLETRIFYPAEVEAFAEAFFDPAAQQHELFNAIRPAVDRFRERFQDLVAAREQARAAREHAVAAGNLVSEANAEDALRKAGEALDALEVFRGDLRAFTRLYEFMSQIVPYDDADLEHLNAFTHYLYERLPGDPDDELNIDLSNVELSLYRVQKQAESAISLGGEAVGLRGVTSSGTGKGRDDEEAWLSLIIERLNEIAGVGGAEGLGALRATVDIVREDKAVMAQVRNNPPEQVMVAGDFPNAVVDALMRLGDAHGKLQDNVLADRDKASAYARLVLEVLSRPSQSHVGPATSSGKK